jgi:hypothetical protein
MDTYVIISAIEIIETKIKLVCFHRKKATNFHYSILIKLASALHLLK